MVNYSDYLNAKPLVNDNATLMLLSLLIKLGISTVDIAGFDGFRLGDENYVVDRLESQLDEETIVEMNNQITEVVKEYSHKVRLNFITESLYQVEKAYAKI